MSSRCEQELCPNWSGDGDVCPCAVLDIPRPTEHPCHSGAAARVCGACAELATIGGPA